MIDPGHPRLSIVRQCGLPVQAPTKYELAIHLKTAKSVGLKFFPA